MASCGQIVTAGELGSLLAHPGLQFGDPRRALRLADSLSVVGALAIDRALDCEEASMRRTISIAIGERAISLVAKGSLTSRVFLKIRHG